MVVRRYIGIYVFSRVLIEKKEYLTINLYLKSQPSNLQQFKIRIAFACDSNR